MKKRSIKKSSNKLLKITIITIILITLIVIGIHFITPAKPVLSYSTEKNIKPENLELVQNEYVGKELPESLNLINNERAVLHIKGDKETTVGVEIKDGKITKIIEDSIEDQTLEVSVSEEDLIKFLTSADPVTEIIRALDDGRIEYDGVGATKKIKFYIASYLIERFASDLPERTTDETTIDTTLPVRRIILPTDPSSTAPEPELPARSEEETCITISDCNSSSFCYYENSSVGTCRVLEVFIPDEPTPPVTGSSSSTPLTVTRPSTRTEEDICEKNHWYNDRICDTFCPNPDPDCEPLTPERPTGPAIVTDSTETTPVPSPSITISNISRTDRIPTQPDVCELNNWYNDGNYCDTFCPNPDPDCERRIQSINDIIQQLFGSTQPEEPVRITDFPQELEQPGSRPSRRTEPEIPIVPETTICQTFADEPWYVNDAMPCLSSASEGRKLMIFNDLDPDAFDYLYNGNAVVMLAYYNHNTRMLEYLLGDPEVRISCSSKPQIPAGNLRIFEIPESVGEFYDIRPSIGYWGGTSDCEKIVHNMQLCNGEWVPKSRSIRINHQENTQIMVSLSAFLPDNSYYPDLC